MKYSLKQRLLIIGITHFLLVGIASVALYSTAQKYSFYNERSARAQHVYASFRAVSDHTHRKLSALGQIVEEGTLSNLQERYRNKEALRDALRDVRESIAAELTHVGDVSEAAELEHFNKIELLAEEIIRGSELVRIAVEKNQPDAAYDALRKLRSEEVEGDFIRLIDEAISEELREVRETQLVAEELNLLLTRLLIVILLGFVLLSTLLLYTTWRALTRTLQAFEQATNAYQAGDFSYRVPNNVEDEFSGLALALNNMSAEVESQHQRAKNTHENLEAMIASRTHELKTTNEKLEQISETRKQFLADISHELRTPLTIIQGEADLALRGEAKTAEQFCVTLSRIKEQTVHTTRFVQDLLFVARAEDGKAPLHKRPASIVPLVVEICDAFAIVAAEKNIDIVRSLPSHDLVANVDASKIKQVITILLDNAVRYSYSESAIEVHVKEHKSQAVIEIKDTGIGLPYNEASQVFSRFYRGSEGSGKAAGTGLGLPVAKAIVNAHGGSIDLHDDNGEGTTAVVFLELDMQLRVVQ